MNKEEALKTYRSNVIKKSLLEEYEDADKYIVVNDDDIDLQKFRIPLPEPPDWDKIEGFGLPKKDQVFTYEEYPVNLKRLEKYVWMKITNDKSLKSNAARKKALPIRVFEQLSLDRKKYEQEIKWILTQWYYRLNGKWYWINGKPTYVDGWHWMYLNYFALETGDKPQYWWRDMQWHHIVKWSSATTYSLKLDKEGNVEYDEEGFPVMHNYGHRTILGNNDIKGRRVGDTSKAQNISYCVTTADQNVKSGTQGDDEDTGYKIFKFKTLPAIAKMPFFFKPQIYDPDSQTSVYFQNIEDSGLGSFLDYATTAKKSYYDSKMLKFYHCDEPGKTKNEDVHERHAVVKRCCTLGANFYGFMIYTTTVETIDQKAGKQFFELTNTSHINKIGADGRTPTGLINIFWKASKALEGFIGKYGEPIEDTPTPEQLPYVTIKVYNKEGTVMGAKEYLAYQRAELVKNKDMEGLATLKRLHPQCFRDCFTPSPKNVFFNIKKIEDQINHLRFKNDPSRRGNFYWSSQPKESPVIWMDDEKGRWRRSHMAYFKESQANLYYTQNGDKYPQNPHIFVASADAFRLEKTDSGRMSNGGGAVKWRRDSLIDPNGKDIKEVLSDIIVCTYNFRPDTTDEYDDDMLKMCVYYGALMYPEMNVDNVYRYFKNNNYGGYLMYDIDPNTGIPKVNPGFHMAGQGGIKQKLFNLTRDIIDKRAKDVHHIEWLEECLAIRGLDDLTNYDLFTAVGGCELADQSRYMDNLHTINTNKVDVSGVWGDYM